MPSFTVTADEAGQKLLQALVRRTGQNTTFLHKWIRTGQVRVNGGRRKAFDRIGTGDEVRLPPFASRSWPAAETSEHDEMQVVSRINKASIGKVLSVVAMTDDTMVINKPAGLAVQPGSNQDDSIVDRLHRIFCNAAFMPAPAHRLDKDTSGLLCIGTTYKGLRMLSDAFADHGDIVKAYLAWCAGTWTFAGRLESALAKKMVPQGERMVIDKDGKAASMDIRPLTMANGATLVCIRLLTGRTHQIRVQLSSMGHPLVGDGKYGGQRAFAVTAPVHGMMLHAFRLAFHGRCYEVLPPWQGPWTVSRSDINESCLCSVRT